MRGRDVKTKHEVSETPIMFPFDARTLYPAGKENKTKNRGGTARQFRPEISSDKIRLLTSQSRGVAEAWRRVRRERARGQRVAAQLRASLF